jgi:hypothetical protein
MLWIELTVSGGGPAFGAAFPEAAILNFSDEDNLKLTREA